MLEYEQYQPLIAKVILDADPFIVKYGSQGWLKFLEHAEKTYAASMTEEFATHLLELMATDPDLPPPLAKLLITYYLTCHVNKMAINPTVQKWILDRLAALVIGDDPKDAFFNKMKPGQKINLNECFKIRCHFEFLRRTGSSIQEANALCEEKWGDNSKVNESRIKRIVKNWSVPSASTDTFGTLSSANIEDYFKAILNF